MSPAPAVALLATGRRTFIVEAGRRFHAAARSLLADLGATVRGPDHLIEFASEVPPGFPDPEASLNVLLCATFADASVALAAFGSCSKPVILWALRDPAALGQRLHLNSLTGANLAAHALVRDGVEVRLLYGNPEEPTVRERLASALGGEPWPAVTGNSQPLGPVASKAEVNVALAGLRGLRMGVVGEVPTGFTSCEFDPAWLNRRLGLEVVPLRLEDAFRRIDAVSADRRRQEVEAATAEAPSIAQLPFAQVDRFAAITAALGDFCREERLSSLGLRCWPEFPLDLGVCPCSALGRIGSSGIATQCERDVNGAATMLLVQALGAADSHLVDCVWLDEKAGVVTFWHCGQAPLRLAADPSRAVQGLHANRGLGVAGDFPLRPGRVTITRISHSHGYRLFLSGGEALATPNRFQGNSVDVRLDADAHKLVSTLVERGFEHHTVLAWAEIRPQLRRAAVELGLELVEC